MSLPRIFSVGLGWPPRWLLLFIFRRRNGTRPRFPSSVVVIFFLHPTLVLAHEPTTPPTMTTTTTLEHGHGRLVAGPVHHDPRLGGPAGVGLGGQDLDLPLAARLGVLLRERGRVRTQVAQPLVPRRGHGDGRQVRAARVLDEAPRAGGRGVVVAAGPAELPVRVSLEVEACFWGG